MTLEHYQKLKTDLQELELQTLQVTPGPWHRVTTSVMRRTAPERPAMGVLPMRGEGNEVEIPDDAFWDDVEMQEVGIDEAMRRESGFLGHAEREEDAAHWARCDRELILWLIDGFNRRLDTHRPSEFDDTKCRSDSVDWPCPEAQYVELFIKHMIKE